MAVDSDDHPGLTRSVNVVMQPIAETGKGPAARLWIFECTVSAISSFRAEQRLNLRERAAMAAEIAHDLNNYLAVLSGNTELLQMFLGSDKPKNIERSLSNLHRSLAQIVEFTESCLRLRHLDDGLDPVGLNQFLLDRIAFFKPQKPFRRIIFRSELQDDLPQVAVGRFDLEQVIYNIMCNAADALQASPVENCTIDVRTEVRDANGTRMVRITIADDGTGIPVHIREQLLRTRVSTRIGGSGLGLLTAANIVAANGGSLEIHDRSDGGTEVQINLPAQSKADAGDTANPAKSEERLPTP